jgi:hypothetical protein
MTTTLRLAARDSWLDALFRWALLASFLASPVGARHGVKFISKIRFLYRLRRILRGIPAAVGWPELLTLAREVLAIPPDQEGVVVECGCWKGASSAVLSLVCSLANRRLLICDSFQGLPKDHGSPVHSYPHIGVYGYYEEGMYAGSLEEVRRNIERFGNIEVCSFVAGYFADTLPTLREPVAFAFLDVDLEQSMKDCIRNIWPRLRDGGFVYTDDSCDTKVVRVWFDEAFWRTELGESAPGYVGSGCGLPIRASFSSFGYARKIANPERDYARVDWLRYR